MLPDRAALAALLADATSKRVALLPGLASPQAPTSVTVRLRVAGAAATVDLEVDLLQILAGHGGVVSLPPKAQVALSAWAASLDQGAAAEPAANPQAEARPSRAARAGDRAHADVDLMTRYRGMTQGERVQAAVGGSREMRGIIARDTQKSLHLHVLRNPHVTLDEALMYAGIPSLATEALIYIAKHDTWGRHPGVCTALVRNPKTPLPIAIGLLDRLPRSELRQIAQNKNGRAQLTQAALHKLGA
jgi:hypothetical protein